MFLYGARPVIVRISFLVAVILTIGGAPMPDVDRTAFLTHEGRGNGSLFRRELQGAPIGKTTSKIMHRVAGFVFPAQADIKVRFCEETFCLHSLDGTSSMRRRKSLRNQREHRCHRFLPNFVERIRGNFLHLFRAKQNLRAVRRNGGINYDCKGDFKFPHVISPSSSSLDLGSQLETTSTGGS